MSAGHTLAWVVGIAVVVGAGWVWGCRQAGDAEPKRVPAVQYENCPTSPTRRASGRGTRSVSSVAVAACQVGGRRVPGDAPTPGRPTFFVVPALTSTSPDQGRATSREHIPSKGAIGLRGADRRSRSGQRRRHSPGGALATFVHGVERTAATLRLAAVLIVVGLAVLSVAVETLTPERAARTVHVEPSPETPEAPEGLPAKNDRPGHPKPIGDSSEMCC